MPVYWKPRYPTRVVRERAWAERSLARERQLTASSSAGSRLLGRIRLRLRRG